jgi:endonuclease III
MKTSNQKITRAKSSPTSLHTARKKRARSILRYLKKAYPVPKTELHYHTPFQLVVAVMLSAQCTDKAVNAVTQKLFQDYQTPADFARATSAGFERRIASLPFFRNKTKHILETARILVEHYDGVVPRDAHTLITFPGIAYKTAHVILGELYDLWEGIPTDTHVRRFALRFDLTDNTELTKISKDLERLFPKKDWKYVNNGLVLYGRYVCPAKKHDCAEHPLTKIWPPANTLWPRAH